MNTKKHILLYLLLTVFLGASGWQLGKWDVFPIHQYFIGILSFYFILACIITVIHWLAIGAEDKSPVVILGGVVLRLILTIFFMVFMLLFGTPDPRVFILTTAILYLPYLIFEIILLLPNLRPNSEEN